MSGQDWAAALGGDWCDACGGARGGSSELSLALTLGAPSLQGLHLHVLRRMGLLDEVLAIVGEVQHGLATRKDTQGKLVRSRSPCGAPPTSVLLPIAAVVAPLPQQPIR
jgi:hypothetical protein